MISGLCMRDIMTGSRFRDLKLVFLYTVWNERLLVFCRMRLGLVAIGA